MVMPGKSLRYHPPAGAKGLGVGYPFDVLNQDPHGRQPYRQRFAELARRSDEEIDLAEAALLIAAEEQPGLDPRPWLRRLDQMAAHLQPRLDRAPAELDRLKILNDFLTREVGLRGNSEDYYDPRNSLLNEVLDRGLGIPISLAVVWIEVGRRVGVPLDGVGFPGHFLLRHARYPQIVLDPFAGGRLLAPEDCRELLDQVSGGTIEFHPQLLRPAGRRQILLRMLSNLRGVYLKNNDLARAISVLDRMLLLDPEDWDTLRDRGLLRLQAGDMMGGIEDLEHYLEDSPDVLEHGRIASLLAAARSQLGSVH